MALGELTHVAAIQLRVVGNGGIIPTLFGYNELKSEVLQTIQAQNVMPVEPVRLASFIEPRIKLRLEIQQLNEYFKINHIIIYHKPIFTQGPNTA